MSTSAPRLGRVARAAALLTAALCSVTALHAQPLEAAPPPTAGARTLVFISDLHMGLGRVQQDPATQAWTVGDWHPMEDFRWHDEFDRFMTELERRTAQSGVSVELVILGDFLELWQTPWAQRDCYYDLKGQPIAVSDLPAATAAGTVNWNLSCNADDALKRAARVLGAHQPVLERLRAFSVQLENRVVIVPGNHDAALIFPSVAALVLEKIGAPPDRVRIAPEGYWHSTDGRVFAEHGHMIEGDVNTYDILPASCIDAAAGAVTPCRAVPPARPFLKRPWGEQFVQGYYNQFEEAFPVIDNLTSEAHGVKVAIAEAGLAVSARAARDMFKFLLFEESFAQLSEGLGEGAEGRQLLGQGDARAGWDLEAVRKKGDAFLIESLYPDDPLRAGAEAAMAKGDLVQLMSELAKDPQQLEQLCNLRAARRAEQEAGRKPGPLIELCPGATTLGAMKTKLLTTSAERKSNRLETIRKTLPDGQRPTRDFGVYVYGHTHAAHGACKPREVVARARGNAQPSWNPVVLNSGAWQRLVSPQTLDNLRKSNPEMRLSSLKAEDLPACYSVIVVPSYQAKPDGKPEPTLWFWQRDPRSGNWSFRLQCATDPTRLPKDPCAG